MVINLEQKKIHFDLRFILTYNIYTEEEHYHFLFSGHRNLQTSLGCVYVVPDILEGTIILISSLPQDYEQSLFPQLSLLSEK